MTGVSAARVSFAEASNLLRELACLHIHPKQVERFAKALGQSIALDEREVLELEPPQAPTLYLGLDGTGVPMRHSETQGRKGKQPDGSAKPVKPSSPSSGPPSPETTRLARARP